jgi:glycosyltransferase involved in cell wall biosynthesis
MNVIFFAYTFKKGGAAHCAKLLGENLKKKQLSIRYLGVIDDGRLNKFYHLIKVSFSTCILRLLTGPSIKGIKRSFNLFSSSMFKSNFKRLKFSSDYFFHFHWFGNDSISFKDLKNLPMNSIITLHDEYLLNGSYHYQPIFDKLSFFQSLLESHIIKKKNLSLISRSDITITVSSEWMYKRALSSKVLSTFKGKVIILPTPIDISLFASKFKNRKCHRDLSKINIAFGFSGGKSSYVKGDDIFYDAIKYFLKLNKIPMTIHLYGSVDWKEPVKGVNVINHGYLNQEELSNLFTKVEILVLSSRFEAYGQVVPEAMATGAMVIVPSETGSIDFLPKANKNYIFENSNSKDLAEKLLNYLILSCEERMNVSKILHKKALNHCSYINTTKRFEELYQEINKSRL